MKKLLAIAGFTCFCGVTALHAQPPGGRGGRGGGGGAMNIDRTVQVMKDSLGISAVQADSATAVLKEFQPRQREIFMNQDASPEEKMGQLKAINDQRNARFKGFLTADQYTKFLAMEDRRRQSMRDRAAGARGRANGGGDQ